MGPLSSPSNSFRINLEQYVWLVRIVWIVKERETDKYMWYSDQLSV